MKCENCGAEIKEGFDYCESCGAPAGETVVLGADSLKKVKEYNKAARETAAKKLKEDRAAEKRAKLKEAAERAPFYERKSAAIASPVIGIFAGILVVISPLLPWIRVRGSDIGGTLYVNNNLFQITENPSFMLVLYSALMIFAGVMMLYVIFHMCFDGIRLPYIFFMEWGSYMKLTPAALAIIMLFLITHQGSFERLYDMYREQEIIIMNNKESYEAAGWTTAANMYCETGYGVGFYAVIIGVILFICALGFKFVIDTLNED